MAKEIERKFLIKNDSWRGLARGEKFCQGYLASGKKCIVRVRTEGESCYICIKGQKKGISCFEFEYKIPLSDGKEMLENLLSSGLIEKIRYKIPYKEFSWDVDEFLGDNEGLVLAEIELAEEKQEFPLPPWVGEEVTSDPRYANYNLASNPYFIWKK